MQRAEGIGKAAGLRYVYLGNVPGTSENTYCQVRPDAHERWLPNRRESYSRLEVPRLRHAHRGRWVVRQHEDRRGCEYSLCS
jgi:hypothetical protein